MMMNNTCVSFGTFEFIHKGHKKIAETVAQVAKERGLTPAIVSFEKEGKVFTTEEEKEYLLKSLGIEMVLSFGEISIKELLNVLASKVVVVGEHHAQLNELKLAADQFGIEVITVPVVKEDDRIIDDKWLEELYDASDYKNITKLCGHPYIMIGEVVHGKKLGRTENMPTANIQVSANKKKPKHAVYGARICLGDETMDAVVNIGKRPTVDDFDYTTIEALILDFKREIYGEKLILEVHKFIRDIKKFDSLAEVKEQVDKDIASFKERGI